MSSKKYLVTGATGFLGNNVVRQLLDAGQHVRVLTRAGGGDSRPLAGLDVEVATGDIRDAAAVSRAVQGMDAIVHSAASVHIGWSQAREQQQINVEGSRNIATAAREHGARLVHVSTVNTLGLGLRDRPGDEENFLPGAVLCPYVVTKREAEQVVLSEVAKGLSAAIVNLGFMLGPWDWKPSSGKLVLEAAKFAMVAPSGACSVCDVRDVAAGVLSAAKSSASGRRFVLGGYQTSYRQIFTEFARLNKRMEPLFTLGPILNWIGAVGGDLKTRFTGRESAVNSASVAMSQQDHCFSSSRAEAELGYRNRPMEETITAAWNWFLEYGYVR